MSLSGLVKLTIDLAAGHQVERYFGDQLINFNLKEALEDLEFERSMKKFLNLNIGFGACIATLDEVLYNMAYVSTLSTKRGVYGPMIDLALHLSMPDAILP